MLLLTFTSCISVRVNERNPEVQTSNMNSEEKEITLTLKAMWSAIENNELDLYASFIHPNFTQFGENDTILRKGKAAEIEGIGEWLKNSSDIHTEMIDPKVTIKGDVAWIVYYWADSGLTNGVPFTSKGKSTRIFVKENGNWLSIHGHYTLIP